MHDLVIKNNELIKVNDKNVEILFLPSNVTIIKTGAIENLNKLKYIDFLSNDIYFENNSVVNCKKLFFLSFMPNANINLLPDSFVNTPLLTNESGFFIINNTILHKYNGNEKEVKIPDSIEYISPYAFYKNYELESITMPLYLKIIGRGAFNQCINLKRIIFNQGIKKIEDNAFRICYSLKNIYLPNTINYLGEGVFAENYSLENVIIDSTNINIYPDLFANCFNLKNVYTSINSQNFDKSFKNSNDVKIIKPANIITFPLVRKKTLKKNNF